MVTWFNKTDLAKKIALFASIAGISLGLCGANFVLFSRYGYVSGPNDPTRSATLSMVLMATGFVELIGIIVGVGGFLIAVICLLGLSIYEYFSRSSKDED